MRTLTRALGSAFLVFLAAMTARGVSPTRVFLGLNGNNANDCSNPATPCFSFAGALAQVATGGEVIIEATGGYGPLNITKSVSINAAAGVVGFSCCTVTVNAPGGVVVLRGLTIDGGGIPSGNGIDVASVSALHVESCVVTGFPFNGSQSTGNGIYFTSSGLLFVKDTLVRGNGYVGIWMFPSSGTAKASIDRSRIDQNLYGLIVETNAAVTARKSVFAGNGNAVQAEINANAEINLESCVVTGNANGLASSTGVIRASNTTVTKNSNGLSAINGGSILSRGNNTVEGNSTNGAFTGTYSAK